MTDRHPAEKAHDEVLDELADGGEATWEDIVYAVEEMRDRWKLHS